MPLSELTLRYRRHAPWLVAVALACLFLALLAWEVLTWLRISRDVPDQSRLPAPPAEAPQDPGRLGRLFGDSSPSDPGAASSSNLVLLGSFVHANPDRSTAILQLDAEPPKRFHPGDEIANGVRLRRVHADHVEILRNGLAETLRFVEPPLQGVAPAPPTPTPAAEPAPFPSTAEPGPPAAPPRR